MQEEILSEDSSPIPTPKKSGRKPDFRIVQASTDVTGKAVYGDVGAMWKNTSKSGSEFYSLKIGKLKLLVFPNVSPRGDAPPLVRHRPNPLPAELGGEAGAQPPSNYPKNQQGKI